jgi:hypothetical protein
MSVQDYRDTRTDEQTLLDSVERAISERSQAGRADEARYGFVARVANATPPVNESFQRTLRARVVAELAKDAAGRQATVQDRLRTLGLRRLSLVGGLATILILVTAFVLWSRVWVWEPQMETGAPTAAPVAQLAPGDVDALADRLNSEPASRTVAVFPGGYAGVLAERVQHPVVPLSLGGDLTPAAIQAALGAVLPSSGLVDVVIVKGDMADAVQRVRTALEQRLYRLYRPGESTAEAFGALERNQFVAAPKEVALEPVGAVFEGGIELVATGVLDDPHPGEPLRLAFDWRVVERVGDSLVMFVHLVRDGGHLVAQRDAVPGNGLFPVESWEPGEVVRDQFALQLPPELPPGEYEIQVGVYSATSGQRYRLVEPEEGVYIVVRRFTVEGGG